MAREISVIQQQMIDSVAADATLSPVLTSTSKRAIWRLWTFITATGIGLLEQLMDLFKADVENTLSKAPPGSPLWVQDRVFKFQYSATSPQVIQVINLVPQYPVIDPTLRIISRCSVTTDLANEVTIKVAKGDPPQALSGPELAALQSYFDPSLGVGVGGINYNVTSSAPDRLYLQAQIYYVGLYSSVIMANVITAINNYLAGIPFNGRIVVSDLEIAIKQVAGVQDVIFQNVIARANSTPFGGGTALVGNNTLASRFWPTLAGYAISEDTAGQTLTDSLTFIPQ